MDPFILNYKTGKITYSITSQESSYPCRNWGENRDERVPEGTSGGGDVLFHDEQPGYLDVLTVKNSLSYRFIVMHFSSYYMSIKSLHTHTHIWLSHLLTMCDLRQVT